MYFTAQEVDIIFGVCRGLTNEEIAQQCNMTKQAEMTALSKIFDKTKLCTRLELVEFAKAALHRGLTEERVRYARAN